MEARSEQKRLYYSILYISFLYPNYQVQYIYVCVCVIYVWFSFGRELAPFLRCTPFIHNMKIGEEKKRKNEVPFFAIHKGMKVSIVMHS